MINLELSQFQDNFFYADGNLEAYTELPDDIYYTKGYVDGSGFYIIDNDFYSDLSIYDD